MPAPEHVRRVVEDLIGEASSRTGTHGVAHTAAADPDCLLESLDSLGLVELVVALEEAFGVALPADLMTVTTFASVDAVVDAVLLATASADG